MAYSQLEELCSRRHEKVAAFLTAENMAGLGAIALPVYIVTASMQAFWLRILILIAAAILGIALTRDVQGLAFYERVFCRLKGRVRRRLSERDRLLRPAEFTAAPAVQGDRALPVGGAVRRVKARVPNATPPRLTGPVRPAASPRAHGLSAKLVAVADAEAPRRQEPAEPAAIRGNGHGRPADAATAVIVEDGDAA